jgi:hypothetical protein
VCLAAAEAYHRKGQNPFRTFVTLIPFVVFFGSFAIWTYLSKVALQENILMTVGKQDANKRQHDTLLTVCCVVLCCVAFVICPVLYD